MSVQLDVITYEIELDIDSSGVATVNIVDGFTIYSNGTKIANVRALDFRNGSNTTVRLIQDGGRVQVFIDGAAPATLQSAYDNGNGTITLASGKPFQAIYGLTLLDVGSNVNIFSAGAMSLISFSGNLGIVSSAALIINSSASGGNKTLSTVGSNFWSLTNPGAVTWARINTDNTVSALSANNTFNALAPSQTGNSGKFLTTDGTNTSWATVSAGGTWGSITGTLSDQTDLQTALDGKWNFGSASTQTWTANQTYTSASKLLTMGFTTLGANSGVTINSTGTDILTNGTTFKATQSGVNGTGSQTSYAGWFENVRTGSGINVGVYANASGGTKNFSFIGASGLVSVGSSSPASVLNVASFNMSVTGQGTTINTGGLQVLNSSNLRTFSVRDDGETQFGSTANYIYPQTNNSITLGGEGLGFLSSGQTGTGAGTSHIFTGPSTKTSGESDFFRLFGTFTVASGTADYRSLRIKHTINQSGTANGLIFGIDYDPALTSILGTHYAWRNTSGSVLINGSTITANTMLDVRGIGTTTNNLVRFADSGNTARLVMTDNGSASFTPSVTSGTGSTAGAQFLGNSLTTGNLIDASSTSLTSGRLARFNTNSTVIDHTVGTNGLVTVSMSGAFSTSGKTAVGISSILTGTGTSSTNIPAYFSSSGATTNYGLQAVSSGGTIAYGIYASAANASTNWAGYFDGNMKVTGTRVNMAALPTSSAGLATGDLYTTAGAVMVA